MKNLKRYYLARRRREEARDVSTRLMVGHAVDFICDDVKPLKGTIPISHVDRDTRTAYVGEIGFISPDNYAAWKGTPIDMTPKPPPTTEVVQAFWDAIRQPSAMPHNGMVIEGTVVPPTRNTNP